MNCKEKTLEETLHVRNDAMRFFLNLIDEFKKTGEFFMQKCRTTFSNDLADCSVLNHLIVAMKTEAWNLIERADELKKAQKEALLPLTNRHPGEELQSVLSQVLNINFLSDVDMQIYRSFQEVGRNMFEQLFLLETSFITSDAERDKAFSMMLERYKDGHPDSLKYYIDDVYNVKEAKANLRRDFSGSVAVECWNNNARKPFKTIDAMLRRGCTELDLLPLLEYVAKYEMLSSATPEAVNNDSIIDAMKNHNGPIANNIILHQNVETQIDKVEKGGIGVIKNKMLE